MTFASSYIGQRSIRSGMILTEADLAPYRDSQGLAFATPLLRDSVLINDVEYRVLRKCTQNKGVPETFLTRTQEVFQTNWHIPEPSHAPQDTLQAIPVLAFRKSVPVLNPALEWWGLLHQCAGLLCSQMSMIATRLRPKPAIAPHLDIIVRQFYDAGRLHEGDLNPLVVQSYVETLHRLERRAINMRRTLLS